MPRIKIGITMIENKWAHGPWISHLNPCQETHNVNPFLQLWGGGGHLWPKGFYLNKLGRGPLDNATYQISGL